jgi:hypothetical protein
MKNLSPKHLPFAIVWALALMSIPAAAQGTAEQRAACQGDGQRLCGQYIPDVERITACMVQNHAHLSHGCRVVFESSGKRARARD